MGIGKRLKEARSKKMLTQQELADIVGVTGGAIGNYENETSHPRDTVLYALINALDVDANFLFQDEMKKFTSDAPDNLTKEQREYVEKYFELYLEGRERVHATINFEYAKQQGEKKTVTNITQPSNVIDFPPPEVVSVTRYLSSVCAGTGNYLDENIEHEEVKVIKNKCTYGADYIVPLQGDSMEPEFHDGDTLIVSDARGKECFEGRVGIFIVNGDAYLRRPLTIEGGVKVLRAYNPKYKDIVLNEYTDVRYIGYVVCILDDSWVAG